MKTASMILAEMERLESIDCGIRKEFDRWLILKEFIADNFIKFDKTYCSQCGGEFGPRDSGYSHCKDHRKERHGN
jgi:hypothetical protein